MMNTGDTCDMKLEFTSVTVLHIEKESSVSDAIRFLRQRKKIAADFFLTCPIVVDLKNSENSDNINFIIDLFETMKNEGFLAVGVSGTKSGLKNELADARISTFSTSTKTNLTKVEEPSKQEEIKETPKEQTKPKEEDLDAKDDDNSQESQSKRASGLPLTKHIQESVRGGQRIVAEHQNIHVHGSVNENGEVISSGSIIIDGSLNGKAFAGAGKDSNFDTEAVIIALKFNATIVAINQVYEVFEDGVPDAIKNKPVLVKLVDGRIVIKKLL